MSTILVLIGSLREKSYNRAAFNLYQKIAGERMKFVEGRYDDFPLYNDDLREKNGPPESVAKLGEAIRKADGVLFFSPEYNYSVPGPLKNALDWLSRLPEQPFAGKPAAIIGASPGKIGSARMQYHLRQIGIFLDIRFMNKPEVMISEVHKLVNEKNELTDEGTRKFLEKHLEAFEAFIKSK